MTCDVRILAMSQHVDGGPVLTTFELRYWRAIHAEMMTHRVFSRNAGSSRAIPVKTMLRQVWDDPAGPIHWGANQAGMQAKEQLSGWRLKLARGTWKLAGRVACGFAWSLMKLGLHKQVANRLLEPWQYINVVVSATEWNNFFKLRCHEDAQPEIQELTRKMQEAMQIQVPFKLYTGDWHLPYVTHDEWKELSIEDQLKLSTARCARVSYAPFDGVAAHSKEFERHDKLVGSEPIHASPTEHQAQCMGDDANYANFKGWRQYRALIEKV
jgi:hypothetical protein